MTARLTNSLKLMGMMQREDDQNTVMAKSMFKRMKKIEDRLDRLEALILSEKKPFNIEEAVRDGILSAVKPVREKEEGK